MNKSNYTLLKYTLNISERIGVILWYSAKETALILNCILIDFRQSIVF